MVTVKVNVAGVLKTTINDYQSIRSGPILRKREMDK